eukprot:TRINITY_DN9710_c0_g1_i1.p1 TRINITY_DN9710_c0_g1~~TRINITY_DN9710_c0_g1_i1.p1  ORF type:complete len:1326 (-),score=247.40 TRINITY_DN9710_c0_g1_i1:1039-5016(-)
MSDLDTPLAFPGRFAPRQRHRGQTSISRDLFDRVETETPDAPPPWKQPRERFRSPSPIGSDGSRSPHGGLRLQESNASELSNKEEKEKNKAAWKFPVKVACHVLGVLVALYVFQWSRRFHEQRWDNELKSICDDRARLIAGMFKTNCDHVRTFQMFMTSFNKSAHEANPSDMITETLIGPTSCRLPVVPRVSEEITNDFLERTMFARPWSHRIGYVAFVGRKDRSAFEKCMGTAIVDWHTREVQKDNSVFMVKTHGANVSFLDGIDMLSISDFHFHLLTRVRSAEGLTMSAPYPLMTSKEKRLGVGVVLPVRSVDLPAGSSAAERERATNGCIMTTIDFESSVDQELREHDPLGDDNVLIRVDDITDPSHTIPLYEPEHEDPATLSWRGDLKPPGFYSSDGDVEFYHWGKSTSSSSPVTGNWLMVPLNLGDVDRRHRMGCKWKTKKPIPAISFVLGAGVFAIYMLLFQVIFQALRSFHKMKEDFGRMAALKQAADAGNRAKSAFLAAMTNEVRTPMNGVLGMINLLLRTNLDPLQQDYARTAEASGKALIYLINDVLDFANIESGNLELESIAFNLRVLIDEILNAQAPLVYEKKGSLEVASLVFDSVPQTVIGDAARVRQLLSSIVGNAVKFTQSGHVLLTVTEDRSDTRRSGSNWFRNSATQPRKSGLSSPETSPNGSPFHSQEFRPPTVRQPPVSYSSADHPSLSGRETADGTCSWPVVYKMLQDDEVKLAMSDSTHKGSGGGSLVPVRKKLKLLFRVEDTGIGIPDEAKVSIFQPFSSLAGQAQSLYGGTGIGLALAQRLVHLMGGEIDFVSHEGIGSTFSFSLLLDVLDKPQGGEQVPWTSLPRAKWTNPSLPSIQGKKALVVDGRPLRQQVLASYLRRLGFQVDVCENIFGAVVAVQDSVLQHFKPDSKSGESGASSSGSLSGSGGLDSIADADGDGEGAPSWDVVLVDADAGGLGAGHEFGRLVMRAGEVKSAMRAGYALPKLVLLTPGPLNEEEAELAKANFFAATIPKPLRATPMAQCLQEVLHLDSIGSGPTSQGRRQQLADVLKGKKLLVVDPNSLNRKVASATMLKLGAEAVVSVASGPEALRSLRPPHDFHCVLLDINMDGYDTARKIRTMEDRFAMSHSPLSSPSSMDDADSSGDIRVERIPIVGLTTDMSQGGWLECERAGMNAYVTKPIEEEALVDALSSALGIKITMGTGEGPLAPPPQPFIPPSGLLSERAPSSVFGAPEPFGGPGAFGAPGAFGSTTSTGHGAFGSTTTTGGGGFNPSGATGHGAFNPTSGAAYGPVGGHHPSGPTSRGGQMPSPSLRNWLGKPEM